MLKYENKVDTGNGNPPPPPKPKDGGSITL